MIRVRVMSWGVHYHRVCVFQEVCPTCMRFSQVSGPRFVTAAEASSLLSRQCVSCPPFRLFRVRVTTLAAHRARIALTCGLRVVTCLRMPHWLLPLICCHLFPGFLCLLLSLLQRLLLQGYAGHSCLRLWERNGRLVICVVGRAGVEEQGFFSVGMGWSEEHLKTEPSVSKTSATKCYKFNRELN